MREVADMRECQRTRNPLCSNEFNPNATATNQHSPLSEQELADELLRREALLQERSSSLDTTTVHTDQWRVYQEVIPVLTNGGVLQMLVQAAAGTGKSFL